MIEGRQDQSIETLGNELLHELDLLCTVGLVERPFPDQLDVELDGISTRARVADLVRKEFLGDHAQVALQIGFEGMLERKTAQQTEHLVEIRYLPG